MPSEAELSLKRNAWFHSAFAVRTTIAWDASVAETLESGMPAFAGMTEVGMCGSS
jgi:hypothetical protein